MLVCITARPVTGPLPPTGRGRPQHFNAAHAAVVLSVGSVWCLGGPFAVSGVDACQTGLVAQRHPPAAVHAVPYFIFRWHSDMDQSFALSDVVRPGVAQFGSSVCTPFVN